MGESLFGDLPPPSNPPPPHPSSDEQPEKKKRSVNFDDQKQPTPAPLPPPPPLKSALKRPKPPQDDSSTPVVSDGGSGKRIRFKTTTDASEAQVIDAMKKIASHIKLLTKFSKASKLAIQLIEAKSVKPSNSNYFVAILEAAMSSSVSCNNASVRSDYHALFTAAQDVMEFLNKKQRNDLCAWTIRAINGTDLHTDDSFVFSKAASRVKDLISGLPIATEEDDIEEAAALKDKSATENEQIEDNPDSSAAAPSGEIKAEESDPFGLDALLSSKSGKDDKAKAKDTISKISNDEDETKRFLKLKREALIYCLEIAAKRYKVPWCQTVIDILAKHAFDNVSRFTALQREAIAKLWASIHEQHVRRKQGKSVSGKLDLNGFEWLQQKYSNEKISIRRAVGGSGDRRCQQWLG